jgi:hypothetical protein
MRMLLLTAVLALGLGASSGCFIPAFNGSTERRTVELLHVSESLRLAMDDWERIWFLDQPDHGTPYRTHGGLL